jgi:hypothetical protein
MTLISDRFLTPEHAGAVLLSRLKGLQLKPGDAISKSQVMLQWQGTIYSFAEMGSGIDHLLAQNYLERRPDDTDVFYLTQAGFEALRKPPAAPGGSRTS